MACQQCWTLLHKVRDGGEAGPGHIGHIGQILIIKNFTVKLFPSSLSSKEERRNACQTAPLKTLRSAAPLMSYGFVSDAQIFPL